MQPTFENCQLRTLKASEPERFPTETFVVLHSVDDDGPPKYVREDENVSLLQAGARLRRKEHTHRVAYCEQQQRRQPRANPRPLTAIQEALVAKASIDHLLE